MNTKVTLVVLLAAVGIGLFAIIKLTGSGTSNTNDANLTDRTSQRLLDPAVYDPANVSAIEVAWADGPTASFERDEVGMWHQLTPVPFKMQSFAMRQLATGVGDLTVSKTIQPKELDEDGALAALRLDPPAATVIYTLTGSSASGDDGASAGEIQLAVHLGSINVGGLAYAQLTDDARVYVVEDTLHRRVFQTDLMSWREKVIFDNLGPEMARINYLNVEADTTFALRQMDKRWRMVAPVQTHLDEQTIGGLTQDLITASVRGFVSDDDAELSSWGLNAPALEIAVETDRVNADGSISTDRQVLLLGHRVSLSENSRYAKVENRPSVFTVPALFVDRVTLTAEELISRMVVDALAADVQSVQIDGPSGVFDLTRTLEGGWQAVPTTTNAAATPVSAAAVQALLARLTSAQGGVELGALAEQDVAMTMLVEGFGGSELAAFAVGTQATPAGVFRVVFDDGSGVIRFSEDSMLPAFAIADYVADPGAEVAEEVVGGENGEAADPDDVSK